MADKDKDFDSYFSDFNDIPLKTQFGVAKPKTPS
jgi:hypothetical protein